MLRRQALGVISNQHIGNANRLNTKEAVKQQASNNNHNIKDENEPPLTSKPSAYDFEIFQEESQESTDTLIKFAAKHGYNFEFEKTKLSDKENCEKKQVIFSSNYDDDDEEDEEEDDDDEHYEVEDYEEESDNFDDEEEGISKLNIAAQLSDEKIQPFNNRSNDSDLMDSSHMSPTNLDYTMKNQSQVITDENIKDDADEDTLHKKLLEERENLLVNCDEYKDEILAHMRKMELENRPKSNYMDKQTDINNSMRSILIDWLVEVSEEYKLNTETLYLAVNYTDRFLSQMAVLRGKLQLVGTSCMYIASKYEEISPPDVSEFVYITDDTYSKKQVLRMEHLVLKTLDFRVTTPTANCFLTHYLRFLKMSQLNTSDKVESLARYLAELTLIESDLFLKFLPSQIAASAIYLSLHTLGKPWTKQISEQLGYNYDLSELKACIISMQKSMQNAPNHQQQAIQEKYKQNKFNQVSQINASKSLPSFIYQ